MPAMIRTDRLILRPITLHDFEAIYAVLSDPVAMSYYPRPYDREAVGRYILWNQDSYRRRGYGLWAAVLKSTGQCIGDCGMTVQTIDGVPEDEIGYHFNRRTWKQGFATEAARAVRDYAFDALGKKRLVSWMTPMHFSSRRVAERIGMRFEKEAIHRYGMRMVVYSILRR